MNKDIELLSCNCSKPFIVLQTISFIYPPTSLSVERVEQQLKSQIPSPRSYHYNSIKAFKPTIQTYPPSLLASSPQICVDATLKGDLGEGIHMDATGRLVPQTL